MTRPPFRFDPGIQPPTTVDLPGLVLGGGDIVRPVRDLVLDPALRDALLQEVAPLLLLPMRLEYRLLDRQQNVMVAETPDIATRRADILRRFRAGSASAAARRYKALAELQDVARKEFAEEAARLGTERELRFRWYPDSDFALAGSPPVSEAETTALAAFRAAAAAQWWALPDMATSAAWQTLAQTVGPFRALHLLREQAAAGGSPAAIGRIAALPRRVALFGLVKGVPQPLGTGADVPANGNGSAGPVSYTPDAIEPGAWLADFGAAVAAGMGLAITDPAVIDTALAADWIIAVGVSGGDGRAEIAALAADGIATGTFGFLAQDSATNNTPGSRTAARGFREDPLGYLPVATEAERGVHDGRMERAADLLAEALDLDVQLLRKAMHGSGTDFEDARAMLRVIGPGILDGVLDGTVWGQDLDENDVIDVLAAAVAARGALPALRVGRNPYGVLPVTLGAEFDPRKEPGFSGTEQTVFGILGRLGGLLRPHLVARAEAAAPRITPDAPERTAEAFEAILQNARVSRRIELVDRQTGETRALGCAYVTGRTPETQPAQYLAALRSKRIADLPDPDESDRTWPLLYRLARVTMTRNVASVMARQNPGAVPVRLDAFEALNDRDRAKITADFEDLAGEMGLSIGRGADRRAGQPAPGRVKAEATTLAQRLFRAFDTGLARLIDIAARPDGAAELETLQFEVFDLLQHRVDAWLTGIAYARLTRRRAAGGTGLVAGYYGMLGQLRAANPGAADDGYIQAPSLAQATTAAILRSAYRRHSADGAFNLDLSSRRVRRGMALVDQLAAGCSLNAALGLRAEKLLRDQPQDKSHLIPQLRRDFPIRTETPPEVEGDPAAIAGRAGAPMLDGMALIDANPARFAQDSRATMVAVAATLADDLDAVSDIVMAEAVHHRAMGAAGAANAWLQVLSGGTLPGRPAFLRLRRPGQAASHRVALMLPLAPVADPLRTAPRALAEPGVAALAEALTGPAAVLIVMVSVSLVADPRVADTVKLDVVADLGMAPIDLMVGGESELALRARAATVALWQTGRLAALGPFSDDARPEDVAAFAVEPQPETGAALLQLADLRRALAQGRPVEPADLNAAADAALGTLDPAAEAALIEGAATEFDGRIKQLSIALERALADFSSMLARLGDLVLRAQTQLGRDAASPEAGLRVVQVQVAAMDLAALAPRIAAFAEPSVLRPVMVTALLAPGDDTLLRLGAVRARLAAKLDRLLAIGGAPAAVDAAAARVALADRVAALRETLDGEALPVFPRYGRLAATTPLLGPPDPLPGGLAVIADWRPVRNRIATLAAALGNAGGGQGGGLSLYPVARSASLTPLQEARDPRVEAEAPRSLHFGVFLAPEDPAATAEATAGVVIDEWVETRASTVQDAALALNYNAPDAQAPNALLLCVPPASDWKAWTDERAARMVAEVIDLMRMRALTSDQRMARVALATGANSVPFKMAAGRQVPRIPQRPLFLEALPLDISGTGLFLADGTVRPTTLRGIAASGMNIAGGFSLKED